MLNKIIELIKNYFGLLGKSQRERERESKRDALDFRFGYFKAPI